ncbi:sterol carrier family protein [Gryllotalpicola sp.]|uniref:sterol carrier family protein n=1 Tax=Gryllotalpicola sp. TaxID=1932787 RepID=UPI00261B1ADC|nr:sterol carrier family protein [Gryllotalpicola sp.]
MAKARIGDEIGIPAVRAAVDGGAPRETVALAVRYLLQLLAERAPGHTLEVRVPPYGAVQCIEGPRHTRGTPPNVVETDPATWLALATGARSWGAALAAGAVQASGARADLTGLVPVFRLRD